MDELKKKHEVDLKEMSLLHQQQDRFKTHLFFCFGGVVQCSADMGFNYNYC